MTPWHLIPKHERALVLRELERDLSCVDCPEAYRAAVALLREAAPYPDEALACRFHGVVVDLDGIDDDGRFIWFVFERSERTCGYVHEFTPLTPAARDLLDALRGDS